MNKGARPLSKEEISGMIESFESSPYYERNKALILLGVCTGFRISELLAVSVSDVAYEGRIKENLYLPARVLKNGKSRSKRIYPEAKDAIHDWLMVLAERYNATYNYPLFYSPQSGKAIATGTAYNIMRRAIEKAGFNKDRVSTHSLRKTFAKRMYDYYLEQSAEGNVVEVMRRMQNELGHEDLESTYSYLEFVFDEEKPSDLFKDFANG